MRKKFYVFPLLFLCFTAYSQEYVLTEKQTKTNIEYKDRRVGIAVYPNQIDGNLQIGYGTQNGMLFLGGGKGYSGIGCTRSDGGLILGKNIYARYTGEVDDYKALVGQTGAKGFSGMKFGAYGRIDFFTKNGSVSENQHANAIDNIRMTIGPNGNIGIATKDYDIDGNMQIGHSTVNGMLFLGGGKGYSGIGCTRSDGGLILGKNIYARYTGEVDDYKALVGQTGSRGFSGMKFGAYGRIDFFSKNGSVSGNQQANAQENIRMRISSSGDVIIYQKLEAQEVKVTSQPGADFVFAPNYNLRPLTEVERFVVKNQHLPEIASAKEMKEEGVLQSEMNQKLLQKIEELTLYLIEQNKTIEVQSSKLEVQSMRIQELEFKNEKYQRRDSDLKELIKRIEILEQNKR